MSRTSAESVKPRRSLVADAQDVDRVRQLVELGARIQLLEAVSSLPRERLVRIYKEVRGESPPKGMLPFSTDSLGKAPVDHQGFTVLPKHYIAGLKITMQHSTAVSVFNRVTDIN